MFSKLMQFISKLSKSDHNVVQETFRIAAHNEFIYGITNGRPNGYNAEAIKAGHEKIGNFIHRGMQIQTRKIKGGV